MGKSSTFLVLTMMVLSACAPSAQHSNGPSVMRGSTGYFDKTDHVDYVHQDPYVAARLASDEESPAAPAPTPTAPAKTDPKPATPATPPAPAPAATSNSLPDRVRQFEISRFDAGDLNTPVRFGADTFKLTVFFKTESPVAFQGKMVKQGSKFHIEKTAENFSLTGDLTDSAPDKTTAVFRLTDLKTQDVIEISYNAFKAKLTVHEDIENPVASNSELRKQIDDLKTNTFGWVNNWTVLYGAKFNQGGPSFYLVDMIRIQDADKTQAAALAFQGESKRTSAEDDAYEWDAQSLNPDAASKVKMVGNSDTGNGRAFQVTLQDKNSKQTSDVLVDVESEKSDDSYPDPADIPNVDVTAPAPEEADAGSYPDLKSPPTPTPKPNQPAKPKVTQIAGDAYLPVNKSLPRTARMARDYGKTLNLRGVQKAIARFMGKDRSRLQNFYDYAYPFRAFAKAVSDTFDVSPIYLYLSVDESEYFPGRQYTARAGDSGRAIGPFQMHVESAAESGVTSAERRYFAPSACGAARYLGVNTDAFKSTDTTIALMGYNQGTGGARTLSKKFGYTWSSIDRLGAGASQHVIDYVNSKLAIYFISNNRSYYRFPVKSGNERTTYPRNGSVVPPNGIHDGTCRQIGSQFFSAGA